MNPEAVRLTETAVSKLTPTQALLVLVIMTMLFFISVYWTRWAARMGLAKPQPDDKADALVIARTDALIRQLSAELARIQDLKERYSTELEHIRIARVTLFLRANSFYDAAIAARTMVHEMQRQLQIEETRFEPLPTLPALEGLNSSS